MTLIDVVVVVVAADGVVVSALSVKPNKDDDPAG